MKKKRTMAMQKEFVLPKIFSTPKQISKFRKEERTHYESSIINYTLVDKSNRQEVLGTRLKWWYKVSCDRVVCTVKESPREKQKPLFQTNTWENIDYRTAKSLKVTKKHETINCTIPSKTINGIAKKTHKYTNV